MLSLRLRLLCSLGMVLGATFAEAASSCNGAAANIASAVAGLSDARAYCSSKYPIPIVTVVFTAPAEVVTKTIASSTVTNTVATSTKNYNDFNRYNQTRYMNKYSDEYFYKY